MHTYSGSSIPADFSELWDVFPSNPTKSEKDLIGLYRKFGYPSMTKYLLIRSMGIGHIQTLLGVEGKQSLDELARLVYENESITVEQITASIRSQWLLESNQRRERYEQCADILSSIENIPSSPMIRGDDVKKYINRQMRDITTSAEFLRLRDETSTELSNYLDWTVYNTITTEMVEIGWLGIENLPENVIPILREKGIFGIDVFVILDGFIWPFDLKITHPGLNYFDRFHWMVENEEGADNFLLVRDDENPSEIQRIKMALKLVNKNRRKIGGGKVTLKALKEIYGSSDSVIKWPIMELLESELPVAYRHIMAYRRNSIQQLISDGRILEWLNMKYQGAPLFRNNNRIFVFLCFSDHVGNENSAIRLKGMIEELTTSLQSFLQELDIDKLHENRYSYEDGQNYTGAFTTSFVFQSNF
jgi:hypothetical protein